MSFMQNNITDYMFGSVIRIKKPRRALRSAVFNYLNLFIILSYAVKLSRLVDNGVIEI